MRLLTCNTHSLVEDSYEEKLDYFIEWLHMHSYDVIALQEVNQSIDSEKTAVDKKWFVSPNENIKIKEDNHMARVVEKLKSKGDNYYWTWIPIKIGYGIYDEGIGIMTKYPPLAVKDFYITENRDYLNWRVRKVVGVKCEIDDRKVWFFSVHMGWWNDEERFSDQLARFQEELKKTVSPDEEVFIMGDLNNPSQIRGQGYDMMIASGWHDTYCDAQIKDDGITVSGLIDGWKNEKNLQKMRIDFIFSNKKTFVKESKVVFNGKNGQIISDHFAVEITR